MKSAYELAMERLAQKDGAVRPLTGEQKKAIHEIESQTKAKLAETEIMMDRDLAKAREAGDAAKVQTLQEQRANELRKIRERGEAEKDRVRRGE
jgi:hypothetical protein